MENARTFASGVDKQIGLRSRCLSRDPSILAERMINVNLFDTVAL